MEYSLVKEVIECLPQERSLYPYFKDKYAIALLERHIGETPKTIRELKQSNFGRLLDKPVVTKTLANLGGGRIDQSNFPPLSVHPQDYYALTVGNWGSKRSYHWNQTSRPGSNLVLHLNLDNRFATKFKQTCNANVNEFVDCGHPISFKREATLAWTRLDMDFNTGEILIEEIQSDLIRDLDTLYRRACANRLRKKTFRFYSFEFETHKTIDFCAHYVPKLKKAWAEVMLASTLWFIHEELGFSKVYYHSYETGKVMKGLKQSFPPKSLYTELPRKFCFHKTQETPSFIRQDKKSKRRLKAANNPEWHLLAC